MAGVAPAPSRWQFFDNSGIPLTGGKIDVFLAGTTTRTDTWQDRAKTTLNTNPITLDAGGRAAIILDTAKTYKFVVKTAALVTLYTDDNIIGAAGLTTIGSALTDIENARVAAISDVQDQEATSVAAVEAAQTAAETSIANDVAAADASALDAENYAAAAATGAKFFDTIALGNAGVADGATFGVKAGGSDGLLRPSVYTRVSAGASTFRYAVLPASEFDASFTTSRVVAGAELAIQDSNSNAIEYIEPATGKRYAIAIDADSINGIPRYRLNKAARSAPNLKASIVHHLSYGQSLALGNGGDIHSLAGVDGGFFDSVMFNANGTTSAGPRAQEGSGTSAQNHASLVPFLEQPLSGAAPAGNFQTPLGNSFRTIKRLLRDEDGINSTDFDYILLGSAPGQSNTAIAGLVKGQTPYNNLIADVTFGLARAADAGKSYAVDVVYWSQGERDIQLNTARVTYKNALLQLYTDLNTDIKALTGQSHDIKLVMYQCSTFEQFTGGFAGANIALAQLDAAKVNSSIVLATCNYALEHLAATNVHLTGFGYAMLGGYYGHAAKRTVIDGDTWANLYPTRLTRQGTILEIEFPDTGYPIAMDNLLFATQTNAGLTAVQTDQVTNNPITSVTVVGPRRVRVVLTNALPGFLRYGFASWGGNLRDTCDIDAGTAREATLCRPVLTFEESFL